MRNKSTNPHFEGDKELPPVEVPLEVLSAEALSNLIESFVLREGTDYGKIEVAHETKISQVRKQLERDEVKIVFDPNTQSVTLLGIQEFNKLKSTTKA